MAMNLRTLEPTTCYPVTYAAEPAANGSRMGGLSPVQPTFEGPHQKYFATIEFADGWCASIFYSFDILGRDSSRDIIDFNNRLLLPSPLLHAVVHPQGRVDELGLVAAEVSNHRLHMGEPQLDLESAVPYARSKVAGTPFLDNVGRCGNAFKRAMDEGYTQLVQFDTPGASERYVTGFPWDPGWLHVFLREAPPHREFAFVVQQ
jgi:hypothetical protein